MDTVDCIVVGAGVVGLAVARTLATFGREVIVLEAEDRIGEHTSSRNSEVIHAGLFYRKGTLRHQLFPRARDRLYAYCAEHGVPHRRLGKLMIARNAEEVARLRHHMTYATEAGVDDLQWLEPDEARTLEPNLSCHAAYLSPSSGVIDSHALMLAYQAELEHHGGALVLRTPVTGAVAEKRGITVETGGLAPMSLSCRLLVNCAGHGAPALARRTAGLAPTAVPTGYYRKGVYFSVSSRPFKRLIYPVHGAHGMDVHVVVDMAGNVRFGPDFEWVDRLDYTVDASRANDFYPAIRSFWSDLPDGALTPAYAGIRPKISGPGEPAVDFMIQGPRDHGVSGLVNLFGIESPGLTASLAIGEHVALLAGVMSS